MAFAALTAIALAGTLYLASRTAAMVADEHALAKAQACATQGSWNRDCVQEVPGTASGAPSRPRKSPLTYLTVSRDGAADMTITFPHARSAFKQLKYGDFVDLTTWRGAVVAVTAQGDREITSDAPSARFRSRLTGTFYAAAFTLVLAAVSVISATLTEWFFVGSHRKPALRVAVTVIFGAFVVAFTGAQLNTGMSITGDVGVGAGVFVAGVGLGAVAMRSISSGDERAG